MRGRQLKRSRVGSTPLAVRGERASPALVVLLVLPRVALASGAAFEAELGQKTGSMVAVTDASACAGTALSASTTTNDLSISLTVATAGDYALWMRVKLPPSSSRAVWVALDAAGVFQDPQDLFDIHRAATSGYTWERVTRRGNGTAAAPEQDPRLLTLSAAAHTLEVRIREPDLLLDRLALSNRLDYVPVDCVTYADPSSQDGGQADGGSGDSDATSEIDVIRGVRANDCPADEYYDLERRACLRAEEPSRCSATRAPLFLVGLVPLGVLATFRRRARRRTLS